MKRRASTIFFLTFLSLLFAAELNATDPATHVSQLGHTAWRIRDGVLSAPADVIAQSKDGYLWFGSDEGLIRFDGINFIKWTPPGWDDLGDPSVQALLGASDGTLWIGTTNWLVSWKDGKLTKFKLPAHGRINQFAEDPEHRIWFAFSSNETRVLCRLEVREEGKVLCFGKAEGIPAGRGDLLSIDREGIISVTSRDTVAAWSPQRGLVSSYTFAKSAKRVHGIVASSRAPDGSELIGLDSSGKDQGLQRLKDGMISPIVLGSFDSSSIAVGALFTDRSGALWVGTTANGLYKIARNRVDHFTSKDGLSGDSIRSFLEDHEGNLWVVTDGGVDSFHDLKAITWSTQEGVSAGLVNSVVATRNGAVLVAVDDRINVIKDGSVTTLPKPTGVPTGPVFGMLEDRTGRYWLSIGTELVVYDGNTFKTVKRHNGEPFGSVTTLVESSDGSIWARNITLQVTLDHIVKDKLVETFADRQLQFGMVSDGQPGIWINGFYGVGHYVDRKMQWIPFHLDIKNERVIVENAMAANTDGVVFATTSLGVWAIKGTQVQRLGMEQGLPCAGAYGIVMSQTHSLFLHSKCGIVEIPADDVSAWLANPSTHVHPRLISSLDGASVSTATYHPLMSLAPDGRIWIGDEATVQVIDPQYMPVNELPPPVHVEELIADRKQLSLSSAPLLPALTRDIEIDYSALSFSVPQKVRFRYILEGRDITWQDPGARRSAFYQDLKPGRYRFHVIAANNDGIWNNTGDTLEFGVQAAWFQTGWFRAFCVVLTLFLIWIVYRMRVRSIAKTLSARFDERLDERTRMALELHDTFLQTVQGSKMVADDALDPAADQLRMRHALERLSLWLGQAVTEGRAALHALRVSTTERNHLAEFLDRTAKEHSQRSAISVALTVIGDARDLHPIVRDEIVRIAEEAIRNACLHSKASQLCIELRYARDLNLNFKDNGVGIDPEVVETGKHGHFGIQGMKDRSARIRAKITITSTLNAGTAITLRVPGDVVYRRDSKSLWRRLRGSNSKEITDVDSQ